MKKLIISVSPVCIFLLIVLVLLHGFKGVIMFCVVILFVALFVFGMSKWVDFVDKHIKD